MERAKKRYWGVPPCESCGEEYDPTCHARDRPAGSVSCRKDVHCYLWDGHEGDCRSGDPRVCTT